MGMAVWFLGAAAGNLALPEGYTLNSQLAAWSFGEYVGTYCVLCTERLGPGDK